MRVMANVRAKGISGDLGLAINISIPELAALCGHGR